MKKLFIKFLNVTAEEPIYPGDEVDYCRIVKLSFTSSFILGIMLYGCFMLLAILFGAIYGLLWHAGLVAQTSDFVIWGKTCLSVVCIMFGVVAALFILLWCSNNSDKIRINCGKMKM